MKDIFKIAFFNALGTAAYIILIANFLFYMPKQFGDVDTVFVPMIILMLLVFSTSVTGFLFFGRPIMWYIDGRKREALTLLFYTLLIFFVITVASLLTLFFIQF